MQRMTAAILVLCAILAGLPALAAADELAPAAAPARVDVDTVTLANGLTLEYAETGRGRGQVVIFLHGYTDSWFSWSRVLRQLPPRFHGYALSQRGHGDSERPATGYEMGDFAADVIAFMDHFEIRKAALVGHSMGSVIAQRVAIDHPDRVSRLVLVGATPNGANAGVLGLLDVVNALADPIDPAFVREFQASTVFQPIPEAFLDRVVAESLKVPARVWQDALEGFVAEDTTAELAEIKVPTLIVWGNQDTVFPLADQQALANGIPRARLLIYPQTGHGVHWERPRRFTEDLVDFLRRPVRR